MKLRFLKSIASGSLAFMEGRTIDVPAPLPVQFQQWLTEGIVEPVRDRDHEIAVIDTRETAVSLRRGRSTRPRAAVVAG